MPFTTKRARVTLWVIQGLLAALFLFAGGFKLAMPLAALAKLSPFPPTFIKFIGICEVTGALGLLLPGLFHVGEGLTPVAAAGLAVITLGATTTTIATLGVAPAVLPFVVSILATVVVLGRRSIAGLVNGH